MEREDSKKVINVIILLILFICLYFAYQYYQGNNFNDFVRGEANLHISQFKRDKKEKYSDKSSYKIESKEFNDAIFFKEVKVEKNQPYRVTCMVKTNNVEAKDGKSGVGAQISIEGSTERSMAITGTQDWQKIEMIFNSENRESVNIGFRLGGYLGNAKGEVWFSDFTIEEGTTEENNQWKFANFIFKTTQVDLNGEQIKLNVTNNDITDIKNTITRFEKACNELSKGKMTAKCDTYNIEVPLTKLSYDEEFGYYVAPEDVEEQIKEIISKNDYDHIFIIMRLRRRHT